MVSKGALLIGGLVVGGLAYLFINSGVKEEPVKGVQKGIPRTQQQSESESKFHVLLKEEENKLKRTSEVASNKRSKAEENRMATNPVAHYRFEIDTKKQLARNEFEEIYKPYMEAYEEFNKSVMEFQSSYTAKIMEAAKNGTAVGHLIQEFARKQERLAQLMYDFEVASAMGDTVKAESIAKEIESIVGKAPPIRPRISKEEKQALLMGR